MAVFSFCSRPPGPCWWHGGSRKAARRLSPPHSSSGSESRKKPLNQRLLRLNLGVEDTEVSTLLSAGLWASIEGEAEATGSCSWGIDLGTSAAQSAVAAYLPGTGRLETVAAFPCAPSLAERGLRDGVGNLYSECARRGELLTLGQRSADIPLLLQAALERFGCPPQPLRSPDLL